jgi:dTDP-4-amino-4,6-dideoxygalactose transaminase
MSNQYSLNEKQPIRSKPIPNVNIPEGRDLGAEEKSLLMEVIDSGFLNRGGGKKMVVQFEKEAAEKYGVLHAVATTSGTAALHTAVAALDLEPGDEIITSPVTDMGTIIAILMQQIIPIFADVDPMTCNITAESIEKQITERTKAIIIVHLFGNPADMDSIMDLAKKYNLKVIEDASQAHWADYKGRKVGTIGDIGCFSLQQSKQMTTGDGGFLITSDSKLHERAALFTDKAWPRGPSGERGHLFLGVNYRMNELTGAVALAQLRKLDSIIERRQKSAQWLANQLKNIQGIIPPKILPDCISSWWMFAFYLDQNILKCSSQDFAAALCIEGIPFSCGYIPVAIFDYPVIKDRNTFGKSSLPWTLPQARKNITYNMDDYPGTAKALSDVIKMNWCEGITLEDTADIYKAIEKVATYYLK